MRGGQQTGQDLFHQADMDGCQEAGESAHSKNKAAQCDSSTELDGHVLSIIANGQEDTATGQNI